MSSLRRHISNRSGKSNTETDWSANDGTVDGNLNCTATRHGWTRTFTVTPETVGSFSYPILESLLQLPSLKLHNAPRIFIENPPLSGQWSKIRFWKDDESLQSVLVKEFFAKRMRDGVHCVFEIRDGWERGEVLSGMSGVGRSLSAVKGNVAASGSKIWSKAGRHGTATITDTEGDLDQDDDPRPIVKEAPARVGRFAALKYVLGFGSPPPPPVKSSEQIEQELINEEEAMKKRGWLPPSVKKKPSRLASITSSANPFFGGSTSSFQIRKRRPPSIEDVQDPFEDEYDGEEINMLGAGESAIAEFSSKQEGVTSPDKWNPFVGKKEKEKEKKKKGKGKKAFTGAELVKVPSDAFDEGPRNSDD